MGKPFKIGLMLAGLILTRTIGLLLGTRQTEQFTIPLLIIIFAGLTLAILKQPYLGIVFTVASLPLTDLLPPIPYATSVVPLIGGMALVSYISQQRWHLNERLQIRLTIGHYLGLLFIAWLFLSNPSAALFLGSRNWLLTFIQLLLLSWLAGKLLTNPREHQTLMWIYCAAAIFSALFAIREVIFGGGPSLILRGDGFTGGANSAARYFTIAFVFLVYLRNKTEKGPFLSGALLSSLAVLVVGVVYSVSRTGFLLLVAAIGMLLIQRSFTGRQQQLAFLATLAITITVIFFIPDLIFTLLRFDKMFQAVQLGTDTVGLRYTLWDAGWQMWSDHPLAGVGIGQFPSHLPFYGKLLKLKLQHLGAHNMYIQVLAETGIIGLILFAGLLSSALKSLWQAARLSNPVASSLAWTWFIVLVLLLLGGITKNDHFDKLLWLVLGIGVSYTWQKTAIQNEAASL